MDRGALGLAIVAGLIAANACSVQTSAEGSSYEENEDRERCDDGLLRLRDVETPPGICVGIVARDLPMARGITQLDDDRFLVTAWKAGPDRDGDGSIWLVKRSGDGWDKERLTTNVFRPHGIVTTESGEVYVAEPGRVFRFHVDDPDRIETVIPDLPSDGLHWATTLAYDPASGSLYVNKGSASDNCALRDESGVRFVNPCPEEGTRAELRRYAIADPSSFTVIGRGLRNSVALAVHPDSHVLVQGENGQNDLNMEDPPEEVNVIGAAPGTSPEHLAQVDGRHYGWPYCFADGHPSPGYSGELGSLSGKPFSDDDCRRFTNRPALLLPPHAAPLGMTYATGNFPFTGGLVVAYHGFASTGHKLVVVDVDRDGVPTGAPPRDLVFGWGGDPERGAPMGKPVSVLSARDGALLVTDDQNGLVLRITCNPARGSCDVAGERRDVMPPDEGIAQRCAERDGRIAAGANPMAELQRDVIDPNCVSCHGNPLARPGGVLLRACDDVGAAELLKSGSDPWVVPGSPERSRILPTIELGMGGLSGDQLRRLREWIGAGAPDP